MTTETLLDLLRRQVESCGDKLAFDYVRYSASGEEHRQLTYRELEVKARAIAAGLQSKGAVGERVLVLCPSGLDFIAAFFGCVYAGAVAVPVHPPVRNRVMGRVASIVRDARARFALATTASQHELVTVLDGMADGISPQWCAADPVTAAADEWVVPQIDAGASALVQYTSGSTSSPKGVVVTHGNLLANLEAISSAWGSVGVPESAGFWLPLHHDMGLIGGILGTLLVGASSYLMPPEAFIERPMRWLETLSRHRCAITAAPNFAFELCIERSSAEERAALDLSDWSTAMCGAEPVRAATLERFTDAFAPAGFRPEAFNPVFGMAEATLLVSAKTEPVAPVLRHVDTAALRDNRVVEVAPEHPAAAPFVGCGHAPDGHEIVIADPATRRLCAAGEVGEIWFAGASVAQGYWGKPAETAETFSAALADSGRGPFLRTGDLGFQLDGELFCTGRLKDLIVIRGQNHYPEDIEASTQDSHPTLLRGRGAAFSVTPQASAGEQLVVVQEIGRKHLDEVDTDEVLAAIRTAITEHHRLQPHAVVLVEPTRIPTTSSGKIRRSRCRERYLDGDLEAFAQWHAPPPGATAATPAGMQSETEPRGAADIAAWLVAQLSEVLGLPSTEIDTSLQFASYGLDSIHAVRLTGALANWLGRELSPTLAYEYPTIDLLAEHLAGDDDTDDHAAPQHAGGDETAGADEPIAIIGIGCRFPGADGPSDFWRLLRDGVDAVTEIPADRWETHAEESATTRWGGFLDQVDQFDPQLFGVSPREAARMDPQQRLLLEVAWEALENAGQVPERLAGSRTGVFIGISTNDYGNVQLGRPALIDAYSGTGNASSIAANRLSYVHDFRGPSMAIDTACSSSLVAVHQACRSLRDGESTLALAGGVNVILSPALGIAFSNAGLMAADGRCKAFDARADGYVRGEGAGVVVLKPLSRALADGDPVVAVIRGTATNQDGRTNGLTAPSRQSQEAVLAGAYRRAGLLPGVVQYVEAHGTGTSLGDTIEAKALGAILAEGRTPGSRCSIGSVKTNLGHLEAAAGVAGLIKVALALQHRAIPPSLHCTEPNPDIPFDDLALRVAQNLTPWPDTGGRAVAGVSSFGFGGANAHAVLAEAPQVRVTQPGDDPADDCAELLPLSARSPEALAALAGRYEKALADGTPLADLSYTAGARRAHHDHRLAAVADTPAAMVEALAAYRQGAAHPGLSVGRCRPGRRPGVVFVFSGQGSQWSRMGRWLYAEEPVFRDALDACDRAMRSQQNGAVVAELFDDDPGHQPLSDIGVIQPALFAVQVALAALWRSWGVEPAAVVGHSLGEVAAAHVAGALGLDDAARVICGRSRLLRRADGLGAMLAVELSEAEARQFVAGQHSRVAVAASNSHRSTVLSGDRAVLAGLAADLEQRGRFCRWVDVDVASHSPQMDALRADLAELLAGIRPTAPSIPMYSTVTGERLSDRALDAAYWVQNLCSPVRFSSAVRRVLDTDCDTFVELSPHPILLSAVREDAEDLDRVCTVVPSLRRDDGGRATLLASLGTLYTRGQPVAWEQLHPWGGRCVAAPTYPWQRDRFWLDAARPGDAPNRAAADAPAWRGPLHSSVHPETVFCEIELGTELTPVLADHRIHGAAVVPASTFLNLVLSGAERAFGPAPRLLRDVVFHRSMGVDARPRTVQLVLRGDPPGPVSFQCHGREPGSSRWSLLVSGSIAAGHPDAADDEPRPPDVIRARCPDALPGPEFYRLLAEHGLQAGPGFQAATELWRRDGEAIARLTSPAGGSSADDVSVPLLDACFYVLAATRFARNGQSGEAYLPVGVSELRSRGGSPRGSWCHALLRQGSGLEAGTVEGDVFLLGEDGRVELAVRGLRLQRIPDASPTTGSREVRDTLFELRWQPAPLDPPDHGAPGRLGDAGSWLIFGDGGTVADTLRDQLQQHSQQCVLVEPGDDFERAGQDRYRLDPARPEHFRRLLDEVLAEPRPPWRGVVHLWSLLTAPPGQASTESLDAARALGPTSVLHLVQALTRSGPPDPPRLWLVTRSAQPVEPGGEDVAIAQAPVWGMGRSIDHEHPELRCGRVDLSSGGGRDELDALVRELDADTPEADVVLRGGRRYVARLARYDDADTANPPSVGFDAEASYLITGGLGGIGRAVATWMAEQGARHLVLLARGPASESAKETIGALRAAGTEVTVARGDVAAGEQIAAVLDSIRESGPPLRGIVHAAGTLDDGILAHLDEQRLRDVMAPKVEGAWNLHALTRDLSLDFFVLFSSAASVLGAPGMAHYAAANAFLDALAWQRRAQGLPALSIDWGPWAQVGIAARPEQLRHLTPLGVDAMPAADGVRTLSHLLFRPATQVAVLYVDWAQWRTGRPGLGRPLLADLRHEAPAGDGRSAGPQHRFIGQLRGAGPQERGRLVESYLREQVAGKLGLAPSRLDVESPLNDLGVDSLIAVELRSQIERDTGIVVPVVQLLDGPSVAVLAGRLGERLADAGPADTEPAAAAGPETTDADRSRWADLLDQLPDVPDDDVDELLRELLAAREGQDEG